jgi:hypothetical protein
MTLSAERRSDARAGYRGTQAYAPPPRHGHIINTDKPGLSYVNPALVEQLSVQLRAQTSECVMSTFGISVNTWVKMRKGMPIRKSVAERLIQRIGLEA